MISKIIVGKRTVRYKCDVCNAEFRFKNEGYHHYAQSHAVLESFKSGEMTFFRFVSKEAMEVWWDYFQYSRPNRYYGYHYAGPSTDSWYVLFHDYDYYCDQDDFYLYPLDNVISRNLILIKELRDKIANLEETNEKIYKAKNERIFHDINNVTG